MKLIFPLLTILTLCALPVRAQITVTAGTLGAATGTSSAAAAPPAGTAVNGVAIVYCWARDSGDTTTVSGYTEIPGTHVNTSTGSHRWFWLRLPGAAITATCNHNTSSDSYARMFVFRGLVTSGNPWDAVNPGVSGTPDSNGEYTASGITAGAQSMVVVFSGYEGNDEANIACTGTDPATYTASYAESGTGSGGSINACSAIKSSAGATGNILVNYGNVAGSHDAGTLAISLTHACSGPTIGAHTVCGATTAEISSPAAFVSATYTPAVDSGVLLVLSWGGGSDPLSETVTSIVNQDGTSLSCFVASPGSTFRLYSGPGIDEEAWAFYYCPAIPPSPSITAIRTNLSASTAFLQEIVVEFSAGTIQTTDFWDSNNTAVSSLEGLGASVSVTNTHANDLLIAYLHNGLPVYPNGGYPPVTGDSNYTPIVADPAYKANEMLEARAVSSTGSQTATITWSGTPIQWFAGIVGLIAVDSGSGQTTPTFAFNLATLPAQTTGNPPLNVATYVTTNGTGAVTFALGAGSVGCSVTSAGLVTITGAAVGTNFCIISASLAANGNFLGAGPISQSFQIAQASFTPIRIKAGSSYTDSQGSVWSTDTSYCTGGSIYAVTHVITNALPGSTDGALYQSERWNNPTCTFSSIPAGTYAVTLKFAENYWSAINKRLFSVKINGTQVLTAFDIFAAAGGQYRAVDKTFLVTTPGVVTVQFINGTADNAKYDAIQIVQSGPPPVSVNVSPSSATIPVGGTVLFRSTVTNATDTSVTWSANAPAGLFTAISLGTFTVTATSNADPTKSGSASVVVTLPPISIVCSTAVAGVSGLATGDTYSITVTSLGRTANCTGAK